MVKAGGAKPTAVSQPGLKKPLPSAKDSTKEAAASGDKPAGAGADKPKTSIGGGSAAANKDSGKPAAGGAEKSGLIKQVSTVGDKKAAGGKGGAADDDDPIEKSLQLRIKAGGITQVISQADAKKMGLKVSAPATTAPADKKPATAASKEESKTATSTADKAKEAGSGV